MNDDRPTIDDKEFDEWFNSQYPDYPNLKTLPDKEALEVFAMMDELCEDVPIEEDLYAWMRDSICTEENCPYCNMDEKTLINGIPLGRPEGLDFSEDPIDEDTIFDEYVITKYNDNTYIVKTESELYQDSPFYNLNPIARELTGYTGLSQIDVIFDTRILNKQVSFMKIENGKFKRDTFKPLDEKDYIFYLGT